MAGAVHLNGPDAPVALGMKNENTMISFSILIVYEESRKQECKDKRV